MAEDQTQVEKLLEHRTDLPDVHKVVIIDGKGDGDWVICLDELEQLGKQLLAESRRDQPVCSQRRFHFDEFGLAPDPGDVSSMKPASNPRGSSNLSRNR